MVNLLGFESSGSHPPLVVSISENGTSASSSASSGAGAELVGLCGRPDDGRAIAAKGLGGHLSGKLCEWVVAKK